jgi:hypothetical protein
MAGRCSASWDKVMAYARAELAHGDTERFFVMFLDRTQRPDRGGGARARDGRPRAGLCRPPRSCKPGARASAPAR